MTFTKEQLKNYYIKLPQDLKDVLFSEEAADIIGKLRIKYNLKEKGTILADETGLVMLGILHPRDFIPDLSEKLGVDRETAKKIAEDINQQIFQKVRISLRKIHGITDQDSITKEAAPIKPQVPLPPAPPMPKISEDIKFPENKIESPKVPLPPRPPAPPPIPKKEPPPVLRLPSWHTGVPQTTPREIPKQEPRPLEIRPLKSPFDSAKPFTQSPQKPQVPNPPNPPVPKEFHGNASETQNLKPTADKKPDLKNLESERGLLVMPKISDVKSSRPDSAPPPGVAFLNKKNGKKVNDPYRENI